jgi:hypothetical protein
VRLGKGMLPSVTRRMPGYWHEPCGSWLPTAARAFVHLLTCRFAGEPIGRDE